MNTIKIENADVIKKFDELKALREGLEEALKIFGTRKKEAFDFLKAAYPNIGITNMQYDVSTNEVMSLVGGHGNEQKEAGDARTGDA